MRNSTQLLWRITMLEVRSSSVAFFKLSFCSASAQWSSAFGLCSLLVCSCWGFLAHTSGGTEEGVSDSRGSSVAPSYLEREVLAPFALALAVGRVFSAVPTVTHPCTGLSRQGKRKDEKTPLWEAQPQHQQALLLVLLSFTWHYYCVLQQQCLMITVILHYRAPPQHLRIQKDMTQLLSCLVYDCGMFYLITNSFFFPF